MRLVKCKELFCESYKRKRFVEIEILAFENGRKNMWYDVWLILVALFVGQV